MGGGRQLAGHGIVACSPKFGPGDVSPLKISAHSVSGRLGAGENNGRYNSSDRNQRAAMSALGPPLAAANACVDSKMQGSKASGVSRAKTSSNVSRLSMLCGRSRLVTS
jgi:hypothetical protein